MVLDETLKHIIRSVRVFNKPLGMFCEVQHIPKFQVALIEFLSRNNPSTRLFCITPVNRRYVEGTFGNVGEDFECRLKNAYLRLQQMGFKIQLHVHLTRVPNLLSLKEKRQMISDAYSWMKSMNFNPTELFLGWLPKEGCIEKIAEELGINLPNNNDYKFMHDYELLGKVELLVR